MSRYPPKAQPQPAQLSLQQMAAAIPKIERRLGEIDEFDVSSANERSDPRISALASKLETLLSGVFGSDTVEYERYRGRVTHLDTAPINIVYGTSIHEVREGLKRGLANAKAQLEAIKAGFLEELEDAGFAAGGMPDRPQTTVPNLAALHPDIVKSCGPLLEAGAYPEAVERSFKIVRDRLRTLTSYERASEAFGKGRLYIHGAAAPHVEKDFNEGARFLMMAIDMFRNEKSHTSEGNIDELEHAYQYLMVSSLALRFLDRAELRQDR